MEGNAKDPRIYPVAPADLQTKLLSLVQNARKLGLVRRGANEATKSLNKGRSAIILIAADTEPLEIVLHLPLLCEAKSVPYVFIDSKTALGRACGVSRHVIAVSIINEDNNPLEKEIFNLRNSIDHLPI